MESGLKLCCEGGSDNSYIKSHLILEHGPTEGPNSCKDKVELIEILMAVWRSVFWDEKTLQEVTQHLDHALLRYRNDLLKSGNKKDGSSVTVKYRHDLKRVLLSYRELQQDPKRWSVYWSNTPAGCRIVTIMMFNLHTLLIKQRWWFYFQKSNCFWISML